MHSGLSPSTSYASSLRRIFAQPVRSTVPSKSQGILQRAVTGTKLALDDVHDFGVVGLEVDL